jgi:hypothetical protein
MCHIPVNCLTVPVTNVPGIGTSGFWSHWREYKTNIGVTNDDSKDSY